MSKDVRFKFDPWAVEHIEETYNVEDDLPRYPCPRVSWTEYALLQMVLELEERIRALEEWKSDEQLEATMW